MTETKSTIIHGKSTCFCSASSFRDVSEVTDMAAAFFAASAFEQTLCWNIPGSIDTALM